MGTLLKTFSTMAAAGVGPRRMAAVKVSGWQSKPITRSTLLIFSSMVVPVSCADGRKRVRRLHALRYSGLAPCRCVAPVLIHRYGELLQVHPRASPEAHLLVRIPTGPKVPRSARSATAT